MTPAEKLHKILKGKIMAIVSKRILYNYIMPQLANPQKVSKRFGSAVYQVAIVLVLLCAVNVATYINYSCAQGEPQLKKSIQEDTPTCTMGPAGEIPNLAVLTYETYPIARSGYHYLWREAEDTESLEPSFEIDRDPECSNGKFLNHPEDTGSSWAEAGVGKATYTITIPVSGEYAFWGRAKWESGCSNVFFVHIDNIQPTRPKNILIGSKPMLAEMFNKLTTLYTWHWGNCQIFNLSKGTHTLTLTNCDDGSALDKFLLTNDLDFIPEGINNWEYRKSFNGKIPAGWKLPPKAWDMESQASGAFLLRKAAVGNAPAFLDNIKAERFYFKCSLYSPDACNIYLNYNSTNNHLRLELRGKNISLYEVRDGKQEKLASEALNREIFSLQRTVLLELFREDNYLYLIHNSRLIFQAPVPLPQSGAIGIDVSQYGCLDKINLSPMEPIHLGDNFYFSPGPSALKVITGNWEKTENGVIAKEGKGMLAAGKTWWRDYQLTCMLTPPKQGACGIGIYARDSQNYYFLEFKNGGLALYLVLSGNRTLLKKTTPQNLMEDKPNRLTINRVGADIQVFCNVREVFRVTDGTFFSGYVVFTSDLPKEKSSGGVLIDDIEIWGIDKIHDESSNEAIVCFKNRMPRVINSVLDNLGATGGIRPGDYMRGRKENEIEQVLSRIMGKPVQSKKSLINFQWVTYSNAYSNYYGWGKGPGFIQAFSNEPNTEHYLWALEKLYGDWTLQFKFQGECELLGIYLCNQGGSSAKAEDFNFSIVPHSGKVQPSEGLQILSQGTTLSQKDKNDWHCIVMEKKGDMIEYRIDDKKLCERKVSSDKLFLRPAIYFTNGNIKLDNLQAYLAPVLCYDFDRNQPNQLAFSDWFGEYSGLKYGGEYYGYAALSNEGKPASLVSRRRFTDDFVLRAEIDLKNSNTFSIGIEGPQKSETGYQFTMKRNEVKCTAGSKIFAESPLNNFSVDLRRLTIGWFFFKNGVMQIYLTDDKGTERLAMEQVVEWDSQQPFVVRLSGLPQLDIRHICIWGKETYATGKIDYF